MFFAFVYDRAIQESYIYRDWAGTLTPASTYRQDSIQDVVAPCALNGIYIVINSDTTDSTDYVLIPRPT